MDPNQNPFAGYSAATAAPPAPAAPQQGMANGWGPAPAAPAPAAPAPAPAAAEGVPPGFGPSLEWQGNDNDPSAKTVRLRDRLNEADTERRKEEEEAIARERAAEIRREERLKKIAYLEEMPENQPAGTGM